jgi:hypothetical protein
VHLLKVVSVPAVAVADTPSGRFVRALDGMLVQLGPQSARASKTIRQQYKPHLELLVLSEYDDLARALWNGGIAPLPHDPVRFNVAPRVDGASPIGAKDLEHQVSYIAARPATIGALLEVASRVNSGPIEVTSLVRHTEYQGALRDTNVNATTAVPMHTMGLAFDIALVNTPLETVYEIRDVLLKMRDAGEIFFIGERKQLVFHVVPHPARLGHFAEVYTRALGARPGSNRRHIVGPAPATRRGRPHAAVTAEVSSVTPAGAFVTEWWAANHDEADITVQVLPAPEPRQPARVVEDAPAIRGAAPVAVQRHVRGAGVAADHPSLAGAGTVSAVRDRGLTTAAARAAWRITGVSGRTTVREGSRRSCGRARGRRATRSDVGRLFEQVLQLPRGVVGQRVVLLRRDRPVGVLARDDEHAAPFVPVRPHDPGLDGAARGRVEVHRRLGFRDPFDLDHLAEAHGAVIDRVAALVEHPVLHVRHPQAHFDGLGHRFIVYPAGA